MTRQPQVTPPSRPGVGALHFPLLDMVEQILAANPYPA